MYLVDIKLSNLMIYSVPPLFLIALDAKISSSFSFPIHSCNGDIVAIRYILIIIIIIIGSILREQDTGIITRLVA